MFDLLLDVVTKLEWVSHFVEWLEGPTGSDHDNRSKAEHPTESRLTHLNTLDFV